MPFAGLLAGGLLLSPPCPGLAKDQLREEFRQTYSLAADGRLMLDNVNGEIRITTWDRAEVKMEAVKKADSQEHLDAVQIEVESNADRLQIKTRYPNTKPGEPREQNPSASVDYTLTVPRQARLEKVATVNGSVTIDGVRGDVAASTVNGPLTVKGLAGEARLSSVNGTVESSFDKLEGVKSVSLKTVNGKVVLTLPPDADADISVKTIGGSISADDGLAVRKGRVGQEWNSILGKGGTPIKVKTVNGGIQIRHSEAGENKRAAATPK